jgi:hypothetical protein
MNDSIRGMRMFKDANGAVFDVPEEHLQKFEDIFDHLKDQQRINFEIGRAKSLPELKEDDAERFADTRGNGYSNGGGYRGG